VSAPCRHGALTRPRSPDVKRPGACQVSSVGLRYPQLGDGTNLLGRGDDFFIHGHRPHGSDGCIVRDLAAEFHRLTDALTQSHGGELSVGP